MWIRVLGCFSVDARVVRFECGRARCSWPRTHPPTLRQNLFLYKNMALEKEAFLIIHQLRGLVNLGLNDVGIPRLPSRFTGDQRLYGLPRGKEERKNKGMSPVKVAAAAAAAAAEAAAEAAAARKSGEREGEGRMGE